MYYVLNIIFHIHFHKKNFVRKQNMCKYPLNKYNVLIFLILNDFCKLKKKKSSQKNKEKDIFTLKNKKNLKPIRCFDITSNHFCKLKKKKKKIYREKHSRILKNRKI